MDGKKINVGLLVLGGVLGITGCRSIYMKAGDRFEDAGRVNIEKEAELTDDPVTCLAYPDIPISRYEIMKIGPAITGLDKSEIEELKREDEWGTQWLDAQVNGENLHIGILTDGSGFFYSAFEDSENYYNNVHQFMGQDELSFEFLLDLYQKPRIDGLGPEEAVSLCDRVIQEAGLPLTKEMVISLDAESMNATMAKVSELGGKPFYPCGAPGSKESDIIPWSTEQEAYAVYYRAAIGRIPLSSFYFDGTYTVFIVRKDGRIVYIAGNTTSYNLEKAEIEEINGLSSREIWRNAQGNLAAVGGEKILEIRQELQVQGGTQTTRLLTPVWAVKYTPSNNTSIWDYFYLDAVTGRKVNPRDLY